MANFTPIDLLDAGLLFEINRIILHPLGIALHVVVEEETGAFIEMGVRRTDDPEGMIFQEDQLAEGAKKLRAFYDLPENVARVDAREKAIGYVCQPIP